MIVDKRLGFWLFVLAVTATMVLGLLIFKSFSGITGSSVLLDKDSYPRPLGDVKILKEELTACCSYKDLLGEEQTCYSLNNRECSHCLEYCKKAPKTTD